MKRIMRAMSFLIALVIIVACMSGCASNKAKKEISVLDPGHPTSISVWTYYNGAQLDAFNKLVAEFNETRGKEIGIIVNSSSQGSVNDLQTNVMKAVNGKVGAEEVPNIFAAYADTAYEIDRLGMLVNIADYLNAEQREQFVESYLTEGDFDSTGSVKIFPIAKSTEILQLNDTDWQAFAEATGAEYSDFATVEGLVATAKRYYEWTDSLTETSNDGKAFYGRDAMANYMIIGSMQLGCEIFSVKDGKVTVNFDHDVVRKLWDAYYIPYVKGYFASSGRFRSDDIKTGNIVSFTGSSSGATYFPKMVITEAAEYDISMKVFPAPQFAGSKGYAVQQGAGMVVTKKSEAEIAASVEFLLWFTQEERNIQFSVNSAYLPVTKSANHMDTIHKYSGELSETMEAVLTSAVETVQNNTLYTTKAFETGVTARSILENAMSDQATADRAIVKQKLQAGKALEEATAEFISDEYFELWYQRVSAELNECM